MARLTPEEIRARLRKRTEQPTLEAGALAVLHKFTHTGGAWRGVVMAPDIAIGFAVESGAQITEGTCAVTYAYNWIARGKRGAEPYKLIWAVRISNREIVGKYYTKEHAFLDVAERFKT